MLPILFEIPIFSGLPIYSYGLMYATAFIVAGLYVKHESIRVGENPERGMDLMFYLLIGALVGGRLFFVIFEEWDRFISNPLMIFAIWEGGLVFYGGLVVSLSVGIWYARRHKMAFWKNIDIFMPALIIAHAIGRLGCFFAGCCYGKPLLDNKWYALVFPASPYTAAPAGIPLYPTQLMESGALMLLFLFIFFYLRKNKKFHGQIFGVYLTVYAILRSLIEMFRGDLERGFIIEPWLSTSQFISIFIFAIGLFVLIRNRKREVI